MPTSPRVLVLVLLLAAPARAATAPSLRCQTTKLQAAGVRVRALLACQANAMLAGAAVDPACVTHAVARFRTTLAGAEARGGCATVGDGPAIESRVDAFVSRAAADAAGQGACGPTLLAGGGRYVAARLAGWKGYKHGAGNAARLVAGQAHAVSGLAAYLGRAQCPPAAVAALTGDAAALVEGVVPPLLCGDGIRDPAEVCDGADDGACPGRCQPDCRCGTPSPFACLAGAGPAVTLSGTYADSYENGTLASGARLDARAASFLASPASLYPVNLRGDGPVCLAGGRVAGQYDRSLTWKAMHDLNNAGLRFENDALTVDGLRIDDVGDGIRPVAAGFTVRAAWLSYVRDDCVENDHLFGGLVEDSLFDGCYVAVSERPSPAILDSGYDGRRDVLTIHGSLLRLEAMPGPDGGAPSAMGHGQFFKWHDRATALALSDDVFLAEEAGQGGADTMGVPDGLVSCAGNVMVWLGSGDYPAPLPACFTVTKDRSVWDAAVAAWHARHPEVAGP